MADSELLLLDSSNPISTKAKNIWCSIEDGVVENFIKNIITSIGTANERQEKFRAIISGVPSPWARVLLTRKAVVQSDLKDTVLDECYKLLKSEWRGLVAAYALYPDSFEFSAPIQLTGKSVSDNNGDMSVRYIYGQMLFDETPIWVFKNEKVEWKDNPPCIQILYYKKNDDGGFKLIPVAATSPYTFLFASVNYDLSIAQREIPWIGNDGKFMDPLQSNKITVNDMQRLYSFLNLISENIKPSENDADNPDKFYINWLCSVCRIKDNTSSYKISEMDVKKHISDWLEEIGRWEKELEGKLESMDETPNPSIPLLFNSKPEGPFALLLNSVQKFYISGGVLSIKNQLGNEILSSNIFIDSDFIAAWDNNPQNGKDHSKSAAYYVITSDNNYALPLPFTKDALHLFENNIESIVGGGSDGYVRLFAKVTIDGRVELELKARIDKASIEIPICKKTYQMSIIPETDGKVFVWPNFYSRDWNKYFYYSEFPSNGNGVKMLPCFDEMEDISTASETDKAKHFLVSYPIDKVAVTSHKYEIIGSTSPLKSIAIRLNKNGTEINGGVLLLKRTTEKTTKNKLREISTLASLQEAEVGIDFGSTNTCAYYKLMGGKDVMPITFSNRRLALVGFDSAHGALACKDELLFISNEGTAFPNGQVKSWLHLHNPLYLTSDGDINKISKLAEEIIGGVPINKSNISIKSMNERIIQTNAGELCYNMKWYSDRENKSRKTAFMKMLWIHICADMIASSTSTPCYPKILNWSFPSSMSKSDFDDLRDIYSAAVEYPFNANSGKIKPTCKYYTEAEAVCAYSIRNRGEVDSSKLMLGIDVGGSTSDIMIYGKGGNTDKLLTQSSIRIAGGFFFNAINSSAKFRRSLLNFHNSHQTNVNTKNIEDVVDPNPEIYSRAPYYLNNVFDQLGTDRDFNYFYSFMRREVRPVFAYPAYVTGILMFYSGLLVRNVKIKNNLDGLKTVEMRYYGKGGRLFEWLLDDVYSDDGKRYYRKCFEAGYGSKDVKLSIIPQQKAENKSEVAIGLVSGLFASVAKNNIDDDGQRIIENYDVIGEKGIRCTKTNCIVEDLDVIPNELFDGGVNMEMPDTLENFSKFIDVFTQFLIDNSILKDVSALENGKKDLRIRAFIQNDPEFIKYIDAFYDDKDESENKSSSVYRMPVFIAAALCYLNDVLLPEVSNQLR